MNETRPPLYAQNARAMLRAPTAITYRRSARGFTLIELLVVIAIIALLVSIIMPTLKNAKELAKQTVCAGNIRQMSMADSYYASDFGDFLPTYRKFDSTKTTINQMHYAVYQGEQYLGKAWDVLLCPSDTIEPAYWQRYSYCQISGNNSLSLGGWNGVFPLFQTDLAMENWNYTINSHDSFRVTSVDGQSMAHGEQFAYNTIINTNPASSDYGMGWAGRQAVAVLTYPHLRERGNFSFLDGHIECMDLTLADTDPRGNRWSGR